MYRVLAIALLSCAPAAVSAAALLHPRLEHVHGGVPTAFTATSPASPVAYDPGAPLAEDGNAMWDPLGGGCIDPTDPAAWTSPGQRDPEVGALCLAQPCARLLTEDEIEHPVLGRPLREGEWDLYLTRHAAACPLGTGEEWTDASGLDLLPPEAQVWSTPARTPDLALASAAPGPRLRGPSPSGAGSFGGFSGGGSSGGGTSGSPSRDTGADRNDRTGKTEGVDWTGGNGGKSTFEPDGGNGDGPSKGDHAGGGTESQLPETQHPTPVPLPASLAMLVTGLAVLRLPRR